MQTTARTMIPFSVLLVVNCKVFLLVRLTCREEILLLLHVHTGMKSVFVENGECNILWLHSKL